MNAHDKIAHANFIQDSEDWVAVEYEDETIYLCKKKGISGIFEVGAVCNVKYKNGCKLSATILTIGSKQFCENAISVRQSQVNTIFPQTENSESADGLKGELSLQVLSEESEINSSLPSEEAVQLVNSPANTLKSSPDQLVDTSQEGLSLQVSSEKCEINSSPPTEEAVQLVNYPANTLKNSPYQLVDTSQEGLSLQVSSEKCEINSSPPSEEAVQLVNSPANTLKSSPDQLVDTSQEGLSLQVPSEICEINSTPPSEEAVQLVNSPVNSKINSPVRGNFESSLDSDVPHDNSDTDSDYVPCSNSDSDIDYVPCSNSDTEKKLNNPLQTGLKEIRKKTKFPQLSVKHVNNLTDIPVEDDSDVNYDNDIDSFLVTGITVALQTHLAILQET
ncbi:hypothetical protein JTE90_025569 [Oedothorax gibbosus]|uniref:Uncharacterized protein n=1 Tax=Oedothorax gibbosus TaxID=931172 RepID=A0AAV6TXB6_9ARAC|nr:hypothetical protein JTE90_025569 [Oedothorax gibbosus]